ncbi:IclR family transcriptional regulator [Pacificibacter maritimus]|uniref:IclR family transcriptional regulator n=1 Tax=Pacificibacter maritimus TaxID=762213 RepID=A0A3N4VC26_9RHOB|nr:IclR family transcriptional regulator [Pacificibacter maritimus]RPE71370.1 IclR family transcriptional regulator [Pacificibacter maritimus]
MTDHKTDIQITDGTVGKALHVLDMVAEQMRPLRFNEILKRSPYPKATLYRLLQTLTNQGLLSYDAGMQTYKPGMRLVRLAHAAWRQSSLAPVARPYLDDLSRALGETIHLAQLDRGQVVYVDKRNAQDPIEMFSQAGKVGPGYCTGVGKAMMAFLSPDAQNEAIRYQSFYAHTDHTLTSDTALRAELAQIHDRGIAYDREEHEVGIVCIAAPILTAQGRMLGAISITVPSRDEGLKRLETFRPAILTTAGHIGKAAENWEFPSL